MKRRNTDEKDHKLKNRGFIDWLAAFLPPNCLLADAWMPFYGADSSGNTIGLDVPDDGSSVVVRSTIGNNQNSVAEFLRQDRGVVELQTDIHVSAAGNRSAMTVHKKQRCSWTLHYRNVENRNSPMGFSKNIVKSSLLCDKSGQSPIAGSYYEARGNSGKYICIKNCATNPFKTLKKDSGD